MSRAGVGIGAVELAAAIVAAVGVLASGATWAHKRWSRRVVVKRVRKASDSGLELALDLYEDRLGENVRDSREDVKRWIGEGSYRRGQGPGRLALYPYIATCRGRACAFFYGEYYFTPRLFLVSYIVARPGKDGQMAIRRMIRALGKTLKRSGCKGIVFELARDRLPGTDPSLSRWRHFQRLLRPFGIQLAKLQIPYVQPRLSLWDSSLSEEQQDLFYGTLMPPHPTESIPKSTVESILHTVYNAWYGGSFEDDAGQNVQWKEYIRKVFERVVQQLPDPVPVALLRRSRGVTRA